MGKAKNETKARAKAWLEGKRRGLWEPQKFKGTAGARPQVNDAQRRARAEELALEGLLSKACAALISEPPVTVNSKVVDQMRSKHP